MDSRKIGMTIKPQKLRHLKVWKLLFSSVAVFSSAVFQDVRHMLYTHRLGCRKDVPVLPAFPCYEALKDISCIQGDFCKEGASDS